MIRLLITLILVPFLLAGCDGSSDSPQTKVENGNNKIARLNEINRSLATQYRMLLIYNDGVVTKSQVETSNMSAVSKLSVSDLDSALPLLQEFSSTSSDVLAIVNSDGVTYNGDISKIERAHDLSVSLIGAIQSEKQGRASKAANAVQEMSRLDAINNEAAAAGIKIIYDQTITSAAQVESDNEATLAALSTPALNALVPVVQEFQSKSADVIAMAAQPGIVTSSDLSRVQAGHDNAILLLQAIQFEQQKRAQTIKGKIGAAS